MSNVTNNNGYLSLVLHHPRILLSILTLVSSDALNEMGLAEAVPTLSDLIPEIT